MKKLILGALLLLSTISLGQTSFQTSNISVDSYHFFSKNEWIFYKDSLVYESKDSRVIKELNKQGKENHFSYTCIFEETSPGSNFYIGFITTNISVTRISINIDKHVISMEIKDVFTNKISKFLYY